MNMSLEQAVLPGMLFVTIILVLAIFRLRHSLRNLKSSETEHIHRNHVLAKYSEELFEVVTDGLLLVNSKGEIVKVNSYVERIFGWRQSELLGQTVEILIPQEYRRDHRRLVPEFIIENRERIVTPDRMKQGLKACHKDGHNFMVEVSLKTIQIDCEKFVVADVRDMSESIKINEEIHQIMVALDSSEDAILIFDAEQLQIIYANEGAIHNLGYSKKELLVMTADALQPEDEKYKFMEWVQDAILANGKTLHYPNGYKRKDGKVYAIDLSIRYVARTKSPYVVTVARDISERLKAIETLKSNSLELEKANQELELERENLEKLIGERTGELQVAKRKAEDANIAKSSFLAAMSHEIRTPMNGVMGMVELLLMSNLDQNQLHRVTTLQESAASLLAIIDEILDFSKIEAGKIELANDPVELVHTTDSVHASLLAIAQSKGVDLYCYRDPTLRPVIYSDALRLRQIITNLVGNSIKFSSRQTRKGKVSLRFEAVKDGKMQIIVEDNGIGIAKESLGAIFEPFKQQDASTVHHFGGTGLGLPITKVLVEKMNGTVEVESEVGVYTKFIVTIPIIAVDDQAKTEFSGTLPGVNCNIYSADKRQSRDWGKLLACAGANVRYVQDPSLVLAWDSSVSTDSKEQVGLIISDHIDMAECESLARENSLGCPSRLVVVRSESNQVVTDMESQPVAQVNSNPNQNTAFRAFLAVIRGTGNTRSLVAGNSHPASAEISPHQPGSGENRQVLVAEDNVINQEVIKNQLEALGYSFDIANDGKEALELWRVNEYAMLLTDLHMPRIDGYTLAVKIRDMEEEGERLPIIAYTANALKGERDRCIDCGMDDYLTKPIAIKDLKATLKKWVNNATEPGVPAAYISGQVMAEVEEVQIPVETTVSRSALKILDVSVLEGLVGDNPSVIERFLREYRKAAEKVATEINAANEKRDWRLVADAAHKLKSSSRSVGAMKLGEICAELEIAGKQHDGGLLGKRIAVFNNALEEVYEALALILHPASNLKSSLSVGVAPTVNR